jgi:hypothetical protein
LPAASNKPLKDCDYSFDSSNSGIGYRTSNFGIPVNAREDCPGQERRAYRYLASATEIHIFERLQAAQLPDLATKMFSGLVSFNVITALRNRYSHL